MRIFLAGTASHRKIAESAPPIYLLESFYYFQDWQKALVVKAQDFLLDSGAFTFMSSSKTHVVWEDYIERYADFINRNKVEKFFELDIDSVIGYDKVLEYRKRLERLTNKPVIPVWHISRGVSEFKKICDEYKYVAIGGIVSKEFPKEKYNILPLFISEAHKRGAKIHGLGFTSTSFYEKVKFDSVDSTTWVVGGKYGNLAYFNGNGMRQYCPSLHGKKPKDIKQLDERNYLEWLKFQKWAVTHL